MTADLNLWTLEYDDVVFDFGTHDTGYPFTKQVVIGAPSVDVGDMAHPFGDGVVFGRDLTRGRRIEFAGAHLDLGAIPASRPWTERLDSSEVIEAAWAAEQIRSHGELVAKLTHVDRGRSVYGRPRNYQADLTVARRGWTTWTGEFVTVDDRFYGTERSVTFPIEITASPTHVTAAPNGGTRRAWPKITFHAVDSDGTPTGLVNPMVHYYNAAGDLLWSIGYSGLIAIGLSSVVDPHPEAVVDCRPWMLGAVLYGSQPAPGRLQGDRMTDAFLPVGAAGSWGCSADSGEGSVTVEWSDTYGSL